MQHHRARHRDAERDFLSVFGEQRGAVFIETLMVYLPVAFFFVLTWQVGELAAGDLVLTRAAAAASREAIVVLADDPRFYAGEAVLDTHGERRRAAIEAVARRVLSASPEFDPNSLELELELVAGAEADVLLLDTRVRADFRCMGSLAFVVCGASGRRTSSATARNVVHPARYEYASRGATPQSSPASGQHAALGG
jgi:hypothetical protein